MEGKNATIVIAGAGPAGLTIASELCDIDYMNIMVFEKEDAVGGISKTVDFEGNRIDIGGHRFFSKSSWVNEFWQRHVNMKVRNRKSSIFYRNLFFDYPLSLGWHTLRNIGWINSMKVGAGYLVARINKRKEESLEDFYINRFGKQLYKMFFESYTEKVWGIHPSGLSADWGMQRVKGLSVFKLLGNMFSKAVGLPQRNPETSLIEEFKYPDYGPGELWTNVAENIMQRKGEICLGSEVVEVHVNDSKKIDYVVVRNKNGSKDIIRCDFFASSMPLKELIESLSGIRIPDEIKAISKGLKYRDFITVGVLIKDLKFRSPHTGQLLTDNWIYIQDSEVKLGRIQIFNNWSTKMVKDPENTIWVGLEYFCNEGDELWEMSDTEFIELAVGELVKLGFIESRNVLSSKRLKMKKAYPSYHGSYCELGTIIDFLNGIENLYCIGRNGQHRYNNMDHSMLTAREAVEAILSGNTDKSKIWLVNAEKEYHEE